MLLALGLSGCSHSIRIESANQNSRVSVLVIHYTSSDFINSLNSLTLSSNRPVSSHYLIPEPLDASYGRANIQTHQLVDESSRAWHAGRGNWKDKTNINDVSIGIELVNRATCIESMLMQTEQVDDKNVKPPTFCFYPDYSEQQIALLIDLSKGILERHPDIHPTRVIGHSDMAPDRKQDPGPRFPWHRLYKAGIGAWYDMEIAARYWQLFQVQAPGLIAVQRALKAYGYHLDVTGELDKPSQEVLGAFQMHFNPATVTQQPDIKTVSILFALIDRYYPASLGGICAAEDDPTSTGHCPGLEDDIQKLAL